MAVRVYDSRPPNEGLCAMTGERLLREVNGAAGPAIPCRCKVYRRITRCRGLRDTPGRHATRSGKSWLRQREIYRKATWGAPRHAVEQLGTDAVRAFIHKAQRPRARLQRVWYYCCTNFSN